LVEQEHTARVALDDVAQNARLKQRRVSEEGAAFEEA
jgi:hypothetical protein